MRQLIVIILFSGCVCGLRAQHPQIRLTDSVACSPVADQGSAPVCWSFGSCSLFESDLLKQYGIRVNLSEMFLARHAYIDKAAAFLASGGTTYFEGGGQFHDVIRVIERHGMVPEAVYTGQLKGQHYHNHTRLDTAMQRCVRRLLRRGVKQLQPRHLRQLNDTLNKYLGPVPAAFLYGGKTYTPGSFAREVLHFRNEWLELVSFADQPLYKKFMLADKYNWAADSFYNVALADLQEIADTALARGWSLGWEGDVTNPGFALSGGYALQDTLPAGIDALRLQNYSNEATERDHMLHLAGAGYDSSGRRWYYLKNSWGSYNEFKGWLYMNEHYFRLNTVILFVNRAALPPELLRKIRLL